MDLAHAITRHGDWLVALDAPVEGETVVALAGFAAHRGYLNFGAGLSVASAAGWLGHQLMFWPGRRHGRAILQR